MSRKVGKGKFPLLRVNLSAKNTHSSQYVGLLAHQEPAISILEIGGTAGGAAPYVIHADPQTSKVFSSRSQYVFSRPTDAESDIAKERLGSLTNQVEFKTLSTDRTPASQGFSNTTFDVIICSFLDPFSDPDRKLANLRQLLKPDGKICMATITKPDLRLSFILHCLQTRSR